MVTPIGAILKAATGDTTKSPGHGGFSSSVTESRRFSRRLKTVTGSKASRFKRNARDLYYFIYAVVTRTRAIRGQAQVQIQNQISRSEGRGGRMEEQRRG